MKKKPLYLTFFIGIILSLYGCTTYQAPESMESKIARFQSKRYPPYRVPQFSLLPSSALPKSRGRGIASISKRRPQSQAKALFSQQPPSSRRVSHRRLYFLTLLGQFSEFKKYHPEQNLQLNSCPHFHTSFIQFNNYQKLRSAQTKAPYIRKMDTPLLSKLEEKNLISFFPELALNIQANGQQMVLLDVLKKNPDANYRKLLSLALTQHSKKLHNELQELCEHGNTDHYYIVENLIRQGQRGLLRRPNSDALAILYKTTLFNNAVLLESLKSSQDIIRAPASSGRNSMVKKIDEVYLEEFLSRLNAHWANEGLKNLKQTKIKLYQTLQQ